MASPVPEGSPALRGAAQPEGRETAARREAVDAAATQLTQDDEQQSPAVHPTDADIAAVCAFCAARGEAPAPLGVPKSVELRLRRAAARARDAVARRKASERQVVAYLELLDENVLKLLYVILYSASLASIALLVVAFGLQARPFRPRRLLAESALATLGADSSTRQRGLRSNTLIERTRAIPIFNVALASTLLVVTLPPFAYLLYRICAVRRAGLVYSHRRRVTTEMRVALISFTVLLQVSYLARNVLELRRPCISMQPFGAAICFVLVEWICWGGILSLFLVDVHWRMPWTQSRSTLVERLMLGPFHPPRPERADAGFIDMGWHWRILTSKVVMWCTFDGLFIAVWILFNKQVRFKGWHAACLDGTLSQTNACRNSAALKQLMVLDAVCLVLYFVWFVVIAATAWAELARRPYKGYRMANQTLRMVIGLDTWPMFTIVLAMTVLWLADWDECNSVVLVWSGVAPAQIQMAAYAVVNAIIVLPFSRVDPRHVVQVALQEFAWTNDEVPSALERRAAVAGGGGAAARLDASEPVFVVERALMALWFSMLAYEDAGEVMPGVPDKDVTLPIVMRLCSLDNMVAFHETRTALHVIAAWSDACIIVAFRGTAEPANFVADMQLCLKSTAHVTDRSDAAASRPRTRWGDRPAAHAGFMHTWTHARVNQRITSFLAARVTERVARTGQAPHVLLCGHSLGGALATLAAMDLREACGSALPHAALTVITFGSPRVGSAALARHYDARVCPDHWAVVNQHDVITHGGRLCGIYKHVGKRVLINPRGDMIVRPDFVEASFQHWIGAESLDDHFLRRYRDAFRAVCCQHGATQQRLDVLLQAMGAQPMQARRRLLPPPPWQAHEHDAEQKEAKQTARAAPRWLQVLLSRVRAPRIAAELCPGPGQAADDRV